MSWAELRASFDATINAATAPGLYEVLRTTSHSLARFPTAKSLIAHLAKDLSADLEAKDEIYAHLVRRARGGGPHSSLAHALLWVGLWPGLSAAISRRFWFWQDCPDDLVSEMTNAFTRLVARMDFNRVRRVAATLVRSTERDVIRASLLRAGHEARRHRGRYDVEQFGAPERDSDQEDSESLLWADLRRALRGREGDPVVQALVLGKGPRHVASTLGLKPAAARKRLSRARKRLRTAVADARINT